MSDLQSKTDEELNRMLAELAGWVAADSRDGFWHVENHQAGEKRGTACYRGLDKDHAERVFFPKFCSSLDEVAKVEAGLTDEQHYYFRSNLACVIRPGGNINNWTEENERQLISPSARQRTIALIQTLQKP